MYFLVDASKAGVGTLSVKAIGPRGTQAPVYLAKGNKHGIDHIKLDPVQHGKYRVSVKWSEEHIPGSLSRSRRQQVQSVWARVRRWLHRISTFIYD